MNINLDDPKLTAYALDELSGEEKTKMETAVAVSPAAQEFVRQLREISGALKDEYDAERTEQPVLPTNILPLPQRDEPWSVSRRLALAAGIALLALIGAIAVGTMKRDAGWRAASGERAGGVEAIDLPAPLAQAKDAPLPPLPQARAKVVSKADMPAEPRKDSSVSSALTEIPFATARYAHSDEKSFFDAASNPLSTFSIDVDTASYAIVRRFLEHGSLPPHDAVRIEELLNYFTYDYAQPNDDAPFSINLDAASCPWSPAHRLVRIGLQGRELPNEKRPASNLVFLLDVSSTMEQANRLPLVKQALRLLVDKLGANDRIAIVVYAGSSGLVLPSTTGDRKEQIIRALENLQAGGSTNGAQGIALAYQTATEHFIKGGVNRVILATDGDFNVGTTSEGGLIRLIQEKAKSGVFLSVLGVGDDNLNDSMMQQLADKGNGNYAYLDSLGEAEKVLVRQINGTLVTIAQDVKIQVEFNPARVASYRLIGYEKRALAREDFNNDKIDAGEFGAGHTVTALYEVVPAGAAANPGPGIPPMDPLKYQRANDSLGKNASPEMLTVKLRYKKPAGQTSKLLARSFTDNGADFASAAPDLKFAAAVAEFGMILRDSEFKGGGSLGDVAEWARAGKGADANGYRAAFIELVRKAEVIQAQL